MGLKSACGWFWCAPAPSLWDAQDKELGEEGMWEERTSVMEKGKSGKVGSFKFERRRVFWEDRRRVEEEGERMKRWKRSEEEEEEVLVRCRFGLKEGLWVVGRGNHHLFFYLYLVFSP